MIHAQPLSDFAMIARAHGPRIMQGEEAGNGVVINGLSTGPRQYLFEVYDMRRRRWHVRTTVQL